MYHLKTSETGRIQSLGCPQNNSFSSVCSFKLCDCIAFILSLQKRNAIHGISRCHFPPVTKSESMNKSKQTTLFQTWGNKRKGNVIETVNNKTDIVDISDDEMEDEDLMLAAALQESLNDMPPLQSNV